jgi:threonine dehydratase
VLYDTAKDTRETISDRLAAEHGYTLVPPYDHPYIVAGQGTAALELFQDVGELDYLFVPCGGAGLLSGCAIAAKTLSPRCKVIGVEPAARTPYLGKVTFPLVQQYVDDIMTVSDEDLVRTMYFVWTRMKLVVEPTGVLGLAAAYNHRYPVAGKRVGAVVSGGNVDIAQAAEWFKKLS